MPDPVQVAAGAGSVGQPVTDPLAPPVVGLALQPNQQLWETVYTGYNSVPAFTISTPDEPDDPSVGANNGISHICGIGTDSAYVGRT